MKKQKLLLVLGVFALLMTSCTSYRHSMREPNSHVEFVASDFELSDPVTGTATVVRILGIDWEHTFGTVSTGFAGNEFQLPIIGNIAIGSASYALYDLMDKNPGYDVIFYPQVKVERHAPIFGLDLYSTTTYTVTARLGKMRKRK